MSTSKSTLKRLKAQQADVSVENEGTIVLFGPLTKVADEWLRENTDGTWFGGALVVEHRYAGPLVQGLVSEGLTFSEGAR